MYAILSVNNVDASYAKTETGNNMKRQHGLTLPELLVALAVTVIVGSIAVPLVFSLKDAMKGTANTQTIVSTVLQNARAIAMKEGQYAGVRFQQDKDGRQYAIYIVHSSQGSNPSQTFTVNYKAVEGRQPVQLPEGIAVADMVVRTKHNDNDVDCKYWENFYREVASADLVDAGVNIDIDGKNINLTDITSFSIIFNAKGQLVKNICRMRNIKGIYRPEFADNTVAKGSSDKIFNSKVNVDNGVAKFIQDDYANLGLGGELSRVQFKIFDTGRYKSFDTAQKKFDYLTAQPDIYVNQFTGKLMGGQ